MADSVKKKGKNSSKSTKKEYYRKKSNYKSVKEKDKDNTKKKTTAKKNTNVKKSTAKKNISIKKSKDTLKKSNVNTKVSNDKVELKNIKINDKIEELDILDNNDINQFNLDTPHVEIEEKEEKENYFKFSDSYDDYEKKEEVINLSSEVKPRKFYFSYEARVASGLITSIIFFIVAAFFAYKATYTTKDNSIRVLEQSSSTYSVCKKDGVCVGQNRVYNTNDISYVRAGFGYNMKYAHKVKYFYRYYGVARITIYDKATNKVINQYEDDLTYAKQNSGYGEDISFSTTIDVNYDKYKNQAMEYVKNIPNAGRYELSIVLYVDSRDKTEEAASVVMPLGEEEFRITTTSIGESSYEEKAPDTMWNKYRLVYIILFAIFTLLGLLVLTHMVDFINKYVVKGNKYLTRLNEILTTYEKDIINSVGDYYAPSDSKLIKVSSIEELVNVRKMINKPIVYTRVNNVKSEFYLEDRDVIYKYTLKEADLEDK